MVSFIHAQKLLALGTRLRVISDQSMAMVKAYYDTCGLNFEPRYFPLIRLLYEMPNISMAEAAKQLGVSHASINAQMNELQKRDWIRVSQDHDDKRAKSLRLSHKGTMLHAQLAPAWYVLEKALNTVMPEELLGVLEKVEDSYTHHDVERVIKTILHREYIEKALSILPYDSTSASHKERFASLNTEWLEQYFTVEPEDHDIFHDPVATIIEPGGVIVMACVEEEIVGTGAIIKRGDDIYEIAKMAVSKPFQGYGIGKHIVLRLIEEARSIGLGKIYLVSSIELPHAVPMYRKMGFVDCPLPIHEQYQRSNITLEMSLQSTSAV